MARIQISDIYRVTLHLSHRNDNATSITLCTKQNLYVTGITNIYLFESRILILNVESLEILFGNKVNYPRNRVRTIQR